MRIMNHVNIRTDPAVVCKDCNCVGYFMYMDDDNDKICCPLCGKFELNNLESSESAKYCNCCRTVVWKSWCIHGHNGCDKNVYYGMWFETNKFIPTFEMIHDANAFVLTYKLTRPDNTVVCGCTGHCDETLHQCTYAYNTGNPFHDYITECCNISYCKLISK